MSMTPEEVQEARVRLGELWGFGRPVAMSELGRALRLRGVKPADTIENYERGHTKVSGPVAVAIEMMLAGAEPPDGIENIKRREG